MPHIYFNIFLSANWQIREGAGFHFRHSPVARDKLSYNKTYLIQYEWYWRVLDILVVILNLYVFSKWEGFQAFNERMGWGQGVLTETHGSAVHCATVVYKIRQSDQRCHNYNLLPRTWKLLALCTIAQFNHVKTIPAVRMSYFSHFQTQNTVQSGLSSHRKKGGYQPRIPKYVLTIFHHISSMQEIVSERERSLHSRVLNSSVRKLQKVSL